MNFVVYNFDRRMEGEADINMDGDKFVFGTWGANRRFYIVKLPQNFLD